MSYSDRFWKKSWDSGIDDLDPKEWESVGHFSQALRRTFDNLPNKAALSSLGIEITFGEIDTYSNQFANMLIDNGFKVGDVVGINVANIPEYPIALVGAMKAGCIVSGVSPLLSDVQMQYQLSDLGEGGKQVALVTLDAIFAGRLVNIHTKLPQLKLVVTTSIGDFLPKIKATLGKAIGKIPKGKVTPLPGKTVLNFHKDILQGTYSKDLPSVKITPDDVCFIQYTGGTTGPPKGAMLTHKNALSDLLIVQNWLGWEPGKGIACSGFPFFHIAGLFFCVNCLYLGFTQILIANPRDTNHICKELAKYEVTTLVNVPSLFQMLLKNPKFAKLDHSSIEYCISAAAPFPVESQKQLESIVGEGKLLEVYGMTETSPLTTMNPAKGKKMLGSIGLPLPNTELKLENPETGEIVPLGEPGEICVKGPMVMQGYYNKDDETKKAIDKDGYMHTGDVAIMDEEGYLKIVDRTKDMIIVGGYKVFSSKIEDIIGKHPAIDAMALIGVPNPDRLGSEIVKAFIQIDPNYSYDGNEEALKASITNFAKDNCAPYEVPKMIEIMEELPLTTVGKVDKKLLRK